MNFSGTSSTNLQTKVAAEAVQEQHDSQQVAEKVNLTKIVKGQGLAKLMAE